MSPVADLIDEAQRSFLDQHGVQLTQADIARISGLSPQRISQLVNEPVKEMPGAETVAALAKALKVSEGLVLQRFLEASGYRIPDEFPVAARKMRTAKSLGQDEEAL